MTALNGFPSTTTAGQGLFNGPSSNGVIQGQAYPDPATRFALRAGIVANSETLPMWGGVGVYAYVTPLNTTTAPSANLGQSIGRATALTGAYPLMGFSVFDQGYNLVNSPSNTVPIAGSGQSMNWYALGSRARIAVACDPALVSLRAGSINQNVAWDFTNQLLVPYEATAYVISSGTYVTGTGVISLNLSTAPAFSAGDAVTLSALTGTGAYASLNGTWTVLTVAGNAITVQGPVGAGAATITGGSLAEGSGVGSDLNVTVLEVIPTGCMTVSYVGGLANYNYNGSAAVIQLTGGTTA